MIEQLREIAARQYPRMMTQVCRDPGSPFFGCWDRNWWHYKIRDFPSIILQQGGYALSLAADLDFGKSSAGGLRSLAAASCRFWNQRALRHGAFEEYYPFEQGYPPAAFSSLAVAKMCRDGIVGLDDVRAGLGIAARQLLSRFEAEAANQQVAGTAALAVIRSQDPSLVDENAFRAVLDKTLALQTSEGWFPEYHGPDLGYLTVTMDCLWDIHDATGDARCREAIHTAFEFIEWFVLGPFGGAGMHNSRNTDYLVPYGLARLAAGPGLMRDRAWAVLEKLYSRGGAGWHFLDAVDDRYWCHYIGHSLFRALNVLQDNDTSRDAAVPVAWPARATLPLSGHQLMGARTPDGPKVLVSTRKGAVFSAIWPDGATLSDYGWLVQSGGKQWVSHWWSTDGSVVQAENESGCRGYLVSHREHASSPWKHAVLRAASFLFGRRLIRVLKKLVIFKKAMAGPEFSRGIHLEGAIIRVVDKISGIGTADVVVRAPRASKRHVASADSFHPEDLQLADGVQIEEHVQRNIGEYTCVTRYSRIP